LVLCNSVGDEEGDEEGDEVGEDEGDEVGEDEGDEEGEVEGDEVGDEVGEDEGDEVGDSVGQLFDSVTSTSSSMIKCRLALMCRSSSPHMIWVTSTLIVSVDSLLR